MELMPNRRDILFFSALPAISAFAASGDAAKLPNIVMDQSHAAVDRQPFGDTRVYFDGPTNQLKSMTAGSLLLKPGMSPHPPHRHAEEEIMVVTEGIGEIVVEGQVTKVGRGAMMYCAAGKLHGVKNTGTQPLLFYFYKWRA
jgi:mannose-6-phosphate isomerase-like protein (cupin superfamily)